MKMKLGLCLLLLSVTYCQEHKTYVTVFTQNNHNIDRDMYLYISSSRPHDVHVDIFAPFLNEASPNVNLTLSPGQREKVTLESDIQMPVGTLTSNRTVTVIADDDVTVLAMNKEGSNMDMYQVKESLKLGRDYLVVTPEAVSSGAATTVGIASPYTEVNVKVVLPDSNISLLVEIDGIQGNITGEISFTLNENVAFQMQSTEDLSGTYITSDKPIAVISGVNRSSAIDGSCADGQISQLFSLDKLGTRYIVFGLPETEDFLDYVQVVSSQPDTTLMFQGNTSTIAKAREITRYRIARNQFSLLETSSPVVVAMSTRSGVTNKTGDVALYSISPLPLQGRQFTFTVPSDHVNGERYLVLMVESGYEDDVLLDDVPVTDVTWQQVIGTNVSACYYPVNDTGGTRIVRHNKGRPLAVYLQVYNLCNCYALYFEPDSVDVGETCRNTEIRRDLISHSGKRVTSKRMKLLLVEDSNQCFLFCVRYEECIGVNFSTQVNSWEVNCQLVFTQTDGQEDTPDWTYYQLRHI